MGAKRLFLETGIDGAGNPKLVPFGSLDDGFNISGVPETPIYYCIGLYLREFSPEKVKASQNNDKSYLSRLYEFLKGHNVFMMSEVTTEILKDYQKHSLTRVKAASVNREFNTIRNFFNEMKRKRLVNENPCTALKQLTIEKPKTGTWAQEDFEKLKRELHPKIQHVVQFMWLTGARNHEALNLRWSDIDLLEGNMILRSGKNSGGVRSYPITEKVRDFLSSAKKAQQKEILWAEDILEFTRTGKHHPMRRTAFRTLQYYKQGLALGQGLSTNPNEFCKHFRNAVEKAFPGEEVDIRAYSLRHTFCKDLLQKGLSRPIVQKLMGHKDWRTTENYVHWEPNTLKDALDNVR